MTPQIVLRNGGQAHTSPAIREGLVLPMSPCRQPQLELAVFVFPNRCRLQSMPAIDRLQRITLPSTPDATVILSRAGLHPEAERRALAFAEYAKPGSRHRALILRRAR